jgi:hypothetical protein
MEGAERCKLFSLLDKPAVAPERIPTWINGSLGRRKITDSVSESLPCLTRYLQENSLKCGKVDQKSKMGLVLYVTADGQVWFAALPKDC